MGMLSNFKYLTNYTGKKVELLVSRYTTSQTEKGILKGLVGTGGENGIFVELDTGVLVNVRYIIGITILD